LDNNLKSNQEDFCIWNEFEQSMCLSGIDIGSSS